MAALDGDSGRDGRFHEIGHNVYRAVLPWTVPVCVFLIKGESAEAGWTLVDSGMDFHYPKIEEEVLRVLESEGCTGADLRRICITHAHEDHVGSLSALCNNEEKWPNVVAVMHEEEAPLVAGTKKFSECEYESDCSVFACMSLADI